VPIGFLTEAERERLSRFPDEIPYDDLSAYFTLSDNDIQEIQRQRGDHNRLGFTLQLCALRYLGFAPNDLSTAPPAAVHFIARQLDLAPEVLQIYGQRIHTRTDHLLQVQVYLGFRKATSADLEALVQWLLARALEHDKPTLLLALACEQLRRECIVRPGITRLEHLVATARHQAQEETHRRLLPLLIPSRRAWLDALLEPQTDTGRTCVVWLRANATAATAQQIRVVLDKIAFLQQNGVTDWDLSLLNPNRIKFLAQIGRKSTNQYLQRCTRKRRYPILIAFLKQALLTLTDDVVEMFDQCLWDCHSDAKKDLEAFQQRMTSAVNDKLQLFRDLGEVLLDPDVANAAVRKVSFQRVPEDTLRTALAETKQLIRPSNDAYVDFFGRRYSYVRQFAPAFLQQLTFRSSRDNHPLLQALTLLRQLDASKSRSLVPDNAPLAFIPAAWRSYVVGEQGTISRRYYELCTLWMLRQALRAGDIWVENSRRYADPETYLIPPEEWPKRRPEVCELTGTPGAGNPRLAEREADLERLLARVNRQLSDRNSPLRLEDGHLILTPLAAEDRPASVEALADMIGERLPKVDITDLLVEVDHWVCFSEHFTHAAGKEAHSTHFLLYLYACLLAQAGNFGLAQMAENADIPYHQLLWCNTWYIRENTLRAAFGAIVNHHHSLPLSRSWGGGFLSSSDGQRFPVSGKVRVATALPRYFGYGEGVTFYTWTSDQLSQYGIKVSPSTIRDATYVLDEILNNETELPILEHTTDTAGFTDLIFALFDLLGLRFSPRLRDIGSLTLYRLESTDLNRFPKLKDQVTGVVRRQRILERWDDMLRVAGSLKLGWVTASLFVQKLQAFPQQNALTRALQEYGRLIRTLHILRWYDDEGDRRRINRQLNKGEAIHSLRSAISVANKGELRRKQEEALTNQAGCLNLVTNAVILWNTVYTAAVVEQLKKEGYPIQDNDLAQIWPTRHAHINFYGHYHFNIEEAKQRQGLRGLRQPDELSSLAPKISPLL
jgi:TnpA family transposase